MVKGVARIEETGPLPTFQGSATAFSLYASLFADHFEKFVDVGNQVVVLTELRFTTVDQQNSSLDFICSQYCHSWFELRYSPRLHVQITGVTFVNLRFSRISSTFKREIAHQPLKVSLRFQFSLSTCNLNRVYESVVAKAIWPIREIIWTLVLICNVQYRPIQMLNIS